MNIKENSKIVTAYAKSLLREGDIGEISDKKYIHIDLYTGESHYITKEEFDEASRGMEQKTSRDNIIYCKGEEMMFLAL